MLGLSQVRTEKKSYQLSKEFPQGFIPTDRKECYERKVDSDMNTILDFVKKHSRVRGRYGKCIRITNDFIANLAFSCFATPCTKTITRKLNKACRQGKIIIDRYDSRGLRNNERDIYFPEDIENGCFYGIVHNFSQNSIVHNFGVLEEKTGSYEQLKKSLRWDRKVHEQKELLTINNLNINNLNTKGGMGEKCSMVENVHKLSKEKEKPKKNKPSDDRTLGTDEADIKIIVSEGSVKFIYNEKANALIKVEYPTWEIHIPQMVIWLEKHKKRIPTSKKGTMQFIANWIKKHENDMRFDPSTGKILGFSPEILGIFCKEAREDDVLVQRAVEEIIVWIKSKNSPSDINLFGVIIKCIKRKISSNEDASKERIEKNKKTIEVLKKAEGFFASRNIKVVVGPGVIQFSGIDKKKRRPDYIPFEFCKCDPKEFNYNLVIYLCKFGLTNDEARRIVIYHDVPSGFEKEIEAPQGIYSKKTSELLEEALKNASHSGCVVENPDEWA